MSKIEILRKQLSQEHGRHADEATRIERELYAELTRQWDDWIELSQAISKAESCIGAFYNADHDGVYASVHSPCLASIDEQDREAFVEYLRERCCFDADFENNYMIVFLGNDNYMIQSDSRNRRDNGVWQSGKLVIREVEYREDSDEQGEMILESVRNELIEAHMEKNGCFPGVFTIDCHGNVFPVNTLKEADK